MITKSVIYVMTASMLRVDLEKLGLTAHEADVYLCLFQKGKSRAGDLIKALGLHRNSLYQALEGLVARRLVTKTTHEGVFHFQTTDVEHLRDPLREQEVVAQSVIQQLKERARLTDQEITVYEGEDAIRAFSLKNAAGLEPGERIHVLGSGGKRFEQAMGPEALRTYLKEIDTRRGGVRTLMYKRQTFTPNTFDLMYQMRDTQIRILPYELTSAANVVFTNKSVAFQIFEQPYTVVEVRNPHLVTAYKNYFEMLWSQNVRIQHGEEALRDAFYGMVDVLKSGESYAVLGGNLGEEYRRLAGFFDEFHRYRIQRGVVAHILAQREAAPGIRLRNREQGDPEEKISIVKSFQTPFLSPMQINLYQGKAVMILYKPDPVVLYFEDQEIYSGFKLYFDEIWQRRIDTLFGHQGIIELCERVLDEEADLYLIAATGNIAKTHPDYYPIFTKRRLEKGIHLYALANEAARGNGFSTLAGATVRYLPPVFASPMVIWIFGNTVAHVIWQEPETIFVIQDAQVADSYRQYYQALGRMTRE